MKAAVRCETDEAALVLTILESKGMEFDDVFLLDFFTSTPCQSGLRLLENIFEKGGPGMLSNNALLCCELKHLYVAVTRARNRLWIFESSPGSVKSIVKLLTEGKNRLNPLVEVIEKDHPQIEKKLQLLKPTTSSNPEIHSEIGYQLLDRQLYEDAYFCFRKAKDEVGQKIAQANMYMEEGREERSKGGYKNFLNLFQKAVDLFFKTSNIGNAAFCLEEMHRLEEAAGAYKLIGRYQKAASLYLEAGLFLKAFECFVEIERYADAALALRQGEKFNHLVRYLASYRDRLDPEVATGYIKLLAILYKNGRISSKLEGLIVSDILCSDEERIDFYRKCRLIQKLAEFLFVKHQYGQGFQELFQEGYLQEALDAAFRYMNQCDGIQCDGIQCDDIQVSDVITAANYMRFNDILAVSHGEDPNCLVAAGIQSTRIANTFEKWDVFQTSVQHFRGKWAMVFPTLENDLHREIFSLLV
jgi:tetratricopeptide (TPR) repeat protein